MRNPQSPFLRRCGRNRLSRLHDPERGQVMDLAAANYYLFLTNQLKPRLLADVGDDTDKANGVHRIFGLFGKAVAGDSTAYQTLDDFLGRAVAAKIPLHPECLFQLITAATPYQSAA